MLWNGRREEGEDNKKQKNLVKKDCKENNEGKEIKKKGKIWKVRPGRKRYCRTVGTKGVDGNGKRTRKRTRRRNKTGRERYEDGDMKGRG